MNRGRRALHGAVRTLSLAALLLVACSDRTDPPPRAASIPVPADCDGRARPLGPGLTHERWPVAARPAAAVAPCLDLVRADLDHHRMRIVTASRDGEPRPAPTWLDDAGLIAAINAGMFYPGGTALGLLIDDDHEDQPRDNPKLGGYLAFNPREPGLPPAVIAGRDCPGFDLAALRARYRSIVQSYRLLGCAGEPVPWVDPEPYSAAAVALDRAGHIVMVHARAPFVMRDLAQALARPEFGLTGALFVEGGPDATLIVRAAAGHLTLVGSDGTGATDDRPASRLPSLIGLAPR